MNKSKLTVFFVRKKLFCLKYSYFFFVEYRDCLDVYNKGNNDSGTYAINLPTGTPLNVLCDLGEVNFIRVIIHIQTDAWQLSPTDPIIHC